ncbi:MAG: TraR/DksA C4-type zinc finger protein [Sulfurospirillum sp.]|nr:TraR/DksA C4-type zinc finger protein [Sulfurospirillum sp.]
MDQSIKDEISAIIETEIINLQRNITVLEEKSQPVVPDISLGRLTRQEARQEQELSKKLLEDARSRLKRLNFAKSKVASAGYGYCELCDEAIDIERLKIMPESTFCLECLNQK